jgi:hypothetical protein
MKAVEPEREGAGKPVRIEDGTAIESGTMSKAVGFNLHNGGRQHHEQHNLHSRTDRRDWIGAFVLRPEVTGMAR